MTTIRPQVAEAVEGVAVEVVAEEEIIQPLLTHSKALRIMKLSSWNSSVSAQT